MKGGMDLKIVFSILIFLVLILAIIFFNPFFKSAEQNKNNFSSSSSDPSVSYCIKLGYEGKIVGGDGGEHAVCIFPDKTECDTWEFFRGKCGQEFSYCFQNGYTLKDLGENEGWTKGGICIDEGGNEVGNLYDLVSLEDERDDVHTGGAYTGVADPSVIYCTELGYNGKLIIDKDGGEHMNCIFPDKTECDTWEFFRGKCGQEWSYCKLEGYDIKDLNQYEGWFRGGICVDKKTKKEVGMPYEMMNLKSKSSCNVAK